MTSSVGKPERQARPDEQARRGLPVQEPKGCVRHMRFMRVWARVVRQKTGLRPANLVLKSYRWGSHVASPCPFD
ncbi:hypothetical protein ACFX2I_032463 [Malus domestica]